MIALPNNIVACMQLNKQVKNLSQTLGQLMKEKGITYVYTVPKDAPESQRFKKGKKVVEIKLQEEEQ